MFAYTHIGPVRAKRIVDAWAEQKVVREIMMFLHSNGVGTARAVRIYKTYGSDAVQVMTENPYRLTRDVRGIGFKTADAIAMRLGIEKTAMIRLRAGVSFALAEAMDQGHCGLPTNGLIPLAAGLLEAPAHLIETAVDLERSEGNVIADNVGEINCAFLSGLYWAEQTIAGRLIRIAGGQLPWPSIDTAKAVSWVEGRSGLKLADSQRDAVRLALVSKALVITGGPGVGKTTIVNAILRVLRVKGVKMLLCAPTGRAAKRMTEATGIEAKTIHRLLEVDPMGGGFRRNESNCLDCDLLVGELTVSFDGRAVTYGFGELDVLVPAYAATVHKSQGSEYPAVIIPVLTQHYPMLQRNLLYTGVTRGKRLVVLVGQKKAIAIAVRNASSRRRWSKLDEWLRLGASRGSSARADLRSGEEG